MKLRNNFEHDDQILETLALTTKIQKKLKNLVSRNQSLNESQTHVKETFSEQEQMESLRLQVKKLICQNQELYRDNEELCQKIVRLQKSKKKLVQQVAEHKQYIKYLQTTCEDLKKEVMVWMYRPHKREQPEPDSPRFEQLYEDVIKLRKLNQLKEEEIKLLQNSSKTVFQQGKRQYQNRQAFNKKPALSDSRNRLKSKNQCTSCNYLSSSNKKRTVTMSKTKKSKRQLCDCHRQYVESKCVKK